MIYKNQKYLNTKNVTEANFGDGTVHMTNGISDDHCMVVFISGEQRKIGETWDTSDKTWDDIKPEIIFNFTESKSIDAVIEQLTDLKKIWNEHMYKN